MPRRAQSPMKTSVTLWSSRQRSAMTLSLASPRFSAPCFAPGRRFDRRHGPVCDMAGWGGSCPGGCPVDVGLVPARVHLRPRPPARRDRIPIPDRAGRTHPTPRRIGALGDRLYGTVRPGQRPAAGPRGLTTQQPPRDLSVLTGVGAESLVGHRASALDADAARELARLPAGLRRIDAGTVVSDPVAAGERAAAWLRSPGRGCGCTWTSTYWIHIRCLP
jgi:hypothetical protein